jgi:predicted pyridoxine 5'-phosphate oxidase superfamily flavin-nucleotide-binding protein/tRNA A37 methylthiotransferase MiaB
MKFVLSTSPHLDHTFVTRVKNQVADDSRIAQTFVPMGLLSLRSAVEAQADIQIADINKMLNCGALPLGPNFYNDAAEWLLGYGADVIGFMTEADSYHHLIQIFRRVKAKQPKTMTLLGGVHATAVHRETLERFNWIDFVLRGEGETAFQQFIAELSGAGRLNLVGNLTYRSDNDIRETAEQPLISDLDSLPWPDCSSIEVEDSDAIYLEIGRGCPFKCNFCYTAPYWKRKYRIKSAERVIREIRYFSTVCGRTDFNFTHDLFTTDRHWVINFCKLLVESGLKVTWTCSSRTDTLDAEQIYWMQMAGCRNIYFGVEAGTPEMQKQIDKNLDLEQARAVIQQTTEAGIDVTVGFIAGLPGESHTSLRGTLREAFGYLKLAGSTVHLFGFSPYRGSANFNKIRDQLVFDDEFVDFPLPKYLRDENCELMRANFEVFTRFAWMKSYAGINQQMLKAAEEYFPILNAVKSLVLRMEAARVDPVDVLASWAEWIAEANRKNDNESSGLYHGSIADFLYFAMERVSQMCPGDLVLHELISWERQKNRLRGRKAFAVRYGRISWLDSEELVTESTDDSGDAPPLSGNEDWIVSNPSLECQEFRYTHSFLQRHADVRPEPQWFAFYHRLNGEARIARLSTIAKVILELAQERIERSALVDLLTSGDIDGDRDHANSLGEVIRQLEASDLLISSLLGSDGERRLQQKYRSATRAAGFYKNQVIRFLNPNMQAFISRQEMMFIATADRHGAADASFRAGEAGFVRVVDRQTLAFPEYRGNGVMASLGNILENAHIGLLFIDFTGDRIGLHVNGSAKILEWEDVLKNQPLREAIQAKSIVAPKKVERWVVVSVMEAYIHCSKHIPRMVKVSEDVHWGTDDYRLKGGDFFGVKPTGRLSCPMKIS